MEGNTVLHQLMSVRMENVMNGITENDAFYQKTKQRAPDCIRGNIPLSWMPCNC